MERNPLAPALAIGLLPGGTAAMGAVQAPARQAALFDGGSAGALDCVHLHLELQWPLSLFLYQVTWSGNQVAFSKFESLFGPRTSGCDHGVSVDQCVAGAGGARQLWHGLSAAAAAEAG